MKTLSPTARLILFTILLAIGIGSRFLPHPPDATAMTAVIFASALYLGPRFSAVLVISLLLLSDALIGGYELPVMLSVYGSFFLIMGLGMLYARSSGITRKSVILASASLLFFLVTNAAVWYFTPWYTKDLAGLITSYTLALPFLKNMLIGDLVYTATLLSVLALVVRPLEIPSRSAYVA